MIKFKNKFSMRSINLSFAIIAAMNILGPGVTSAILITPGESVSVNYDFSSDPHTGPYETLFFSIAIGDNSWEQNSSVNVEVFDSVSSSIGTRNGVGPISSTLPSGHFFTTGVGVSSTFDPIGFFVITSFDATFDIASLHLRLADSNGPLSTSWEFFPESSLNSSVPIPSTLLFFGLGFAGFAAWAFSPML